MTEHPSQELDDYDMECDGCGWLIDDCECVNPAEPAPRCQDTDDMFQGAPKGEIR